MVLVFGDGIGRIGQIEQLVFPNQELFYRGVLYPAITSILTFSFHYVLWPYIHRKVTEYTTWQEVRANESVKRRKGTELLSLKESIDIQNKMTGILHQLEGEQTEYKRKLSDLNHELAELKQANERLLNRDLD